ncbi:MAG: YitT family protein [Clostridia bacterium]|nr:YitT family protein [Clostridia bacterium]
MHFSNYGKRFFVKALFGTVTLSFLLNLIEGLVQNIPVLTEDRLLASIYGGLVIGIRKFYYFKV